MPPNNPYIPLVENDPDIFYSPQDAYKNIGEWGEYFGNDHDIILEIGTGMGNFFSYQVGKYPDKNFVGMEIRYKRCHQTAKKSRGNGGKNFCIIKDFAQNIPKIFSPSELTETYIFFPDPWSNKERQKKHQLMQAGFLSNLYQLTKLGGKVFFKTDHREYFDTTVAQITSQKLWDITQKIHAYQDSPVFDMKHITEFEGLYRGEEKDVHYLELVKD